MKITRRRRDKDYRGTRTSVDWSKLVHQVRRKKPGSLEVLQDAINTYFPQQFDDAKQDARRASRMNRGMTVLVGFDGRIARLRFKPIESKGTRLEDALADPFTIYSLGRLEYWSQQSRPRIHPIRSSSPAPFTAFVYQASIGRGGVFITTRRGERRALQPTFAGSYKRPKVPVIYWYRTGSENLPEEEGYPETVLLVRGAGSAEWAREHPLYNENWQTWRDEAGKAVGAILTLQDHDEWRKDAREQGLRNKTRFFEYPPNRSFFQS
jgi:hypothetical protein